jgi:hypothetical protein
MPSNYFVMATHKTINATAPIRHDIYFSRQLPPRLRNPHPHEVCNRGPNSDVKADFKNSFSIFFAPAHESQFKLPSDFRGLAQKDGLGCLVCQFESIRQGGEVTPKLFKKVDEIIEGRQPIFLIWLLALQFGKLITDGK